MMKFVINENKMEFIDDEGKVVMGIAKNAPENQHVSMSVEKFIEMNEEINRLRKENEKLCHDRRKAVSDAIMMKRYYMLCEKENAELKKANKVMQDRLMEEGYCAQCEWMEGEMADMEARLDEANEKIKKLEHKIERKDKYIEKIREENAEHVKVHKDKDKELIRWADQYDKLYDEHRTLYRKFADAKTDAVFYHKLLDTMCEMRKKND